MKHIDNLLDGLSYAIRLPFALIWHISTRRQVVVARLRLMRLIKLFPSAIFNKNDSRKLFIHILLTLVGFKEVKDESK